MKKAIAETITPKTLKFYNENGYCLVNGILSKEECQTYLEEAERLASEQPVRYAPLMNPHEHSTLFMKLLAHPRVIFGLEQLVEGKADALQSMLYYKPPGQLGRDLHQDNFYARAERGVYIGTWLSLEATDRENGGLIVYPGSHREPVLDVMEDSERRKTNLADFKNDRGLICVVPPGYDTVYVSRPAGSVVFIHNHLIHGSEANISKTRFRRVFAGHYIKQGCSFREGTHAKRRIINVY